MITTPVAPKTYTAPSLPPIQTRVKPVEQLVSPPVEGPDTLEIMGRAAAGIASGVATSVGAVMLGACAGGAQGIVHGAGLSEDQSNLAFKASLGANLALAGAAAGVGGMQYMSLPLPVEGALAGAASNAMLGTVEWARKPETFRAQVCTQSNQLVDQVITNLPESVSKGQGWNRVARGGVGEVVGAVAGAYAAATASPTLFQMGYQAGTEQFDWALRTAKTLLA